MSKLRLFIPITSKFAVRYIFRTGLLAHLSKFATPLILLAWDEPGLCQEAESLGCEVYQLPQMNLGSEYNRIRQKIDLWYLYRQLRSHTSKIKENQRERVLPLWGRLFRKARLTYDLLMASLPGAIQSEKILLQQEACFKASQTLLEQIRPDAGFCLTPYHWEEEVILRAAAMHHIPLCISILSFDNLTTRGWMSLIFDRYLVWNRYNQAELLRGYPEINPGQIKIVGPAQFDFYWDDQFFWTEEEWRRQLKLPTKRPVLLYAGGIGFHVPHEPEIVRQIDKAITHDEIPFKPIILLRLHPMDFRERWQSILTSSQNIICDEAFETDQIRSPNRDFKEIKKGIVSDIDVIRLGSTLRYSQAHINVCSTMSLDGAIFDRPQIGPAYDDTPGRKFDHIMREHYRKEHFLPIANSGGVDIVHSRGQMIQAIAEALVNPGKKSPQRKRMLEEVCTFVDGQCTQRVRDAVLNFLYPESTKGI